MEVGSYCRLSYLGKVFFLFTGARWLLHMTFTKVSYYPLLDESWEDVHRWKKSALFRRSGLFNLLESEKGDKDKQGWREEAHNLSEKGSMKNFFYKAGRVSFSAQSAELSCLKLGCKSTHVWPEGSYVTGTSNYNYSNTGPFSTGHLPRWFLGDALWISTTVSCQSHRDTTPGWNSFSPAVGQMGYVPSHSSISS